MNFTSSSCCRQHIFYDKKRLYNHQWRITNQLITVTDQKKLLFCPARSHVVDTRSSHVPWSPDISDHLTRFGPAGHLRHAHLKVHPWALQGSQRQVVSHEFAELTVLQVRRRCFPLEVRPAKKEKHPQRDQKVVRPTSRPRYTEIVPTATMALSEDVAENVGHLAPKTGATETRRRL